MKPSQQWIDDCHRWRGETLTGFCGHWCFEWDELPIDETCMEWPCGCQDEFPVWRRVLAWFNRVWFILRHGEVVPGGS